MLREIGLSEYGQASTRPSPVNRMMASFAADFRDAVDINLGVGYVNERTIPSRDISGALEQILRDPVRYRLPFNYGGPRGAGNLLQSLRNYLADNRVGGLTREALGRNDIIIGPSGATSLLEALGQVIRPGVVVTSDPMYYIYTEYLQRKGFRLLTVPEDHDGVRVDILEERLRDLGPRVDTISFFFFVTVNNPSCTILSNERRRRLVGIVKALSERLGRKIPLVFDRAYEDLIHDPGVETPASGLLHDDVGVVYEVGTLSKVIAPALRIGYMIGKPCAFLDAMVQKSSDTGFSASLVLQEIAGYMLDHHISRQIDSVNRGYREKAKAVGGWIRQHLGGYLADCRGGQAGFYFYLTFRTIETHEDSLFFRSLSRTTGIEDVDGPKDSRRPRVIYVPGSFCVNPEGQMAEQGQRELRLSYGFEDLDRIERGIRLMAEAAGCVSGA